jgi:DNA-binding SARP family transcriptional activator
MTHQPMLRDRGISEPPRADRILPVRLGARARAHRAKPLIRVSLLDGLTLRVDGREVALSSRKARALIAYLVLTPGMKETRDRLVGLLWSETEDAKARTSLRQLLHGLRETFDKEGVAGLSTDKFHVSLDGSVFATDLDHALASVDRGDPADYLINETCITESLLRGYDDVDPSFGSWLTIKRESVRQLLVRRLEAQLSDTTHQTEATKRIARALLQIEPTNEIACQKLMLACITSGNAGGALAAYKQLWDRLEQDYDIEPSMATQELVVAIKSGHYRPRIIGFNPPKSKNVATSVEEADSVVLLATKLAAAWMAESAKRTDEVLQSPNRRPPSARIVQQRQLAVTIAGSRQPDLAAARLDCANRVTSPSRQTTLCRAMASREKPS